MTSLVAGCLWMRRTLAMALRESLWVQNANILSNENKNVLYDTFGRVLGRLGSHVTSFLCLRCSSGSEFPLCFSLLICDSNMNVSKILHLLLVSRFLLLAHDIVYIRVAFVPSLSIFSFLYPHRTPLRNMYYESQPVKLTMMWGYYVSKKFTTLRSVFGCQSPHIQGCSEAVYCCRLIIERNLAHLSPRAK